MKHPALRRVAVAYTSLMLMASATRAQDATVIGYVHTARGEPIHNAHVRATAQRAEAVTDDAGTFRLHLVRARQAWQPDTLRVERLGFRSRRVAIAMHDSAVRLDVEMTEVALQLDELVVTATAGTQTRRAQADVVTTIPVSDLRNVVPLSTVADALQGRATSVEVTPSSGSSGEAQRIWMRGATSVTLTNEPLVFIDGVRADSRLQRLRPDNGGQSSSRLFDIDPADVERVEIVKGPAASTMYGADASSGVVQIFTKRGAVGRDRFSQHVELESGVIDANYSPPTNFARCSTADVLASSAAVLCHGGAAGDIVSDNPMLRAGVLHTGETRSVRWSADGGGATFGVYAAAGAETEAGTLPQNAFDRGTLRFNLRWMATPTLLIDAGFGLMRSRTQHPQNGDNGDFGVLAAATLGNPLTVGTRSDGALNAPLDAVITVEQAMRVLRATPTLQIVYTPGPHFNHRLTVGLDASTSSGRFFVPLRDDGAFAGSEPTGNVRADQDSYQLYTVDYLATARLFDAPRLGASGTASAGAQYIETMDDALLVGADGLVSNYASRVSDAAIRTGNERGPIHTKSLGTFGLLELAVHDRLFIQGGARADRNSVFGPGAGVQVFPKAGVSFVAFDGDRVRSPIAVLHTLRLRAAFGTSGRAVPPDAAGATYVPTPIMTGPTTIAQGLALNNPGNPSIRPERGSEVEMGTDAGFFNDHLALELTWFDKRSRDLLARLSVVPSLGYRSQPLGNVAGVIRNHGVEGTLRWTGDVARHDVGAQLGVSTLTNIAPLQHDIPLGAMYDYKVVRADAAAGRAIVTDTTEFVGSSMPSRTAFAGVTIQVISGLSVHAHADGKWGYWQHNLDVDLRDRYLHNSERAIGQAQLGTEERLRHFGPFVTEAGRPVSATAVLGPYLQDASFVRVRDLSLTWDLPRAVLGALGVRNASVGVSGHNLGLWTRYEGDPEVVSFISQDALSATYSQPTLLTMPQSRRWSARISVTF